MLPSRDCEGADADPSFGVQAKLTNTLGETLKRFPSKLACRLPLFRLPLKDLLALLWRPRPFVHPPGFR